MTVRLIFRAWLEPRPPRQYESPDAPISAEARRTYFLLANETWDDYGFKTTFLAHAFEDGRWTFVGDVGIAFRGQDGGSTYDLLGRPPTLETLPDGTYALGEIDFYENLLKVRSVGEVKELLSALHDITIDTALREQVSSERAFRDSLVRSNVALEALEQIPARLGDLAAPEVQDRFEAFVHVGNASRPHHFHFDFSTDRPGASRINVLVGLNGAGKTQSMASIARLISKVMDSNADEDAPLISKDDAIIPRPSIYGVVAISFSAFDHFVVPRESISRKFRYTYCGLKSLEGAGERPSTRSEIVVNEVRERFERLDEEQRFRAVEPLRPSMQEVMDLDAACRVGRLPYELLSAGQRIVLSVTCELLHNVKTRTLVMMDEPEIHLHPQLLSGLIAWTADFLEEMESFAIIATHSPSVVQQVRASSVHVLTRLGDTPLITSPTIETFGANLTEIAHEVFEDREGDRSYQEVLERLWKEHRSADAVNALFDNRLRMNALVFLASLDAQT